LFFVFSDNHEPRTPLDGGTIFSEQFKIFVNNRITNFNQISILKKSKQFSHRKRVSRIARTPLLLRCIKALRHPLVRFSFILSLEDSRIGFQSKQMFFPFTDLSEKKLPVEMVKNK
jgi:hypothetical protein